MPDAPKKQRRWTREGATLCPTCRTGEILPHSMECNHCHQPMTRAEPPEPPAAEEVERNVRRHLGANYQLDGLLGRGGMSLVYLAREKELHRPVALKVLPLQLVLGTAAAERFSREAKIAASLDQHHIVPIYRVGTTSSFLWYTMKYVKGRSLAEVLESHGTLELDATLDIMAQVASALHYAHRRGIVHRDIKPENVLIDEDGWVWVCDFGVAKAFGAIPLTNTGTTLGTPSYMSPEQCYGQSVDGRSDQYSLAALTYRCLAGQTPFVANSLGLMIRKQCLESPRELIELRSDLPPRVSSAVRRALNKKPEDRYPDIVQFIEALGGRVSVRTTNPSLQELTQPTPLPADSPPREPPRRWRRPRARLVAAFVAPLAVAGVVLWPYPDTVRQEAPGSGDGPPVAAESPLTLTDAGEPTRDEPAPQQSPRQRSADRATPAAANEPARLWVQSEQWGYVYLDGRQLQMTPVLDFPIPAGTHTVRIVRDGFEPFEQVIVAEPGQSIRLTGIALREQQP
jgi:serine/threonine-protein kinase